MPREIYPAKTDNLEEMKEVLAGNREISEVPAKLREDVEAELKNQSVGE